MRSSAITAKFGVILRRYRDEKRLSQRDLASLTGHQRTHIGRIERGLINISLTLANHFAHTFGRTLGEMLTEAEQIRGKVEVVPVRHGRRARNSR